MRLNNLSSVRFCACDTFKTIQKMDRLKKDAEKHGYPITVEEDGKKFTVEYQDHEKMRVWNFLKGYGVKIDSCKHHHHTEQQEAPTENTKSNP